jgi:hypothetical protein
MSPRSLLVAALLTTAAAPVAAQDFIWSNDRPDAVAPLGVWGDRTLDAGALELGLSWSKVSQEGIRFGSEMIDPTQLFANFDIVPLNLNTDVYGVRVAFGLSENMTLAGRAGFLMRSREQITEDLTFFELNSEGLSDIEAQALYNVWTSDDVRVHLHLGATIPTGDVLAVDGFEELEAIRPRGQLPYDMQLGAGAWGVSPGITAQIMNEVGAVGGQIVGTRYFLEKQDWRLGDKVEANAWAAYRLNRFLSVSARMHAIGFGAIQGFDPALDPARDPGEFPISYGGHRVDLPVGLNIYVPQEEGRFAGHRLSVEFLFPVTEEFDGPWLATDWGVSVGWQFAF